MFHAMAIEPECWLAYFKLLQKSLLGSVRIGSYPHAIGIVFPAKSMQ